MNHKGQMMDGMKQSRGLCGWCWAPISLTKFWLNISKLINEIFGG